MSGQYGRGDTLYIRKFNLDSRDLARFQREKSRQGYASDFEFARRLVLQALEECEAKRNASAVERGSA